MRNEMRGKAAEFFAGMGLVRRAVERSGFRVVWANDIDATKQRLYNASFPGEAHALDPRDIAQVRAGDIPACELWTASFPCTDLSVAGGRAGIRAGQSGAVWELLRLLAESDEADRPRWALFENVVGLLSSRGGEDLRALVGALNELGYGVDPMRVDARCFTPQSRPRLFLIATRLDDPAAPGRIDPGAIAESDARPRMITQAMRSAPELFWHARSTAPLPDSSARLRDVIEDPPEDSPRWWSAARVDYFLNQLHPKHVSRVRALMAGDAHTHVTAFRRVRAFDGVKRSVAEVRFDGIAGCLRTPKGGSAKQIIARLGEGGARVRHMTARECMRLQGVDEAPPAGAREDELLFALGDAVCVPAAAWVIDQLGAPSMIATDDEAPMRSAPASIMAAASS